MPIEQRTLKTLELFALQGAAVTAFEAWLFLVRESAELKQVENVAERVPHLHGLANASTSLSAVRTALANLVMQGAATEYFGYYTVVAHADLAEKRWTGYQFGVWREKRIRRVLPGLRYMPFVRGVALAGSQALGLQREGSDIDLLIITEPSWLWLSRTLVTAYFQVRGVRRYGRHVANRICLNHYITGAKSMQSRNWYTALEYAKLRPLSGEAAVAAFQKSNEVWLAAFFPNFQAEYLQAARPSRVQRFLEGAIAACGGRVLEALLGRWQSGRIHQNEPHIIVTEDELSFHPNSKQDALLEAFR